MKKLFYLIIFCFCLAAANAQSIVTGGELTEKQNDYYLQPTLRNGVGVKRSIPISTLKSFITDSLSIAISNKQDKFGDYTNEYGFLISQRITPPFNPEFPQDPYQVISFINADDSNLRLKLNLQEKLAGTGFLKLDGESISYDNNIYAVQNNPTLTGTVNLPSTTSIGSISNIELSYVDGVTSSIQTQLNSKLSSVSLSTNVTGILPVANGGTGISSLGTGIANFLGTPSSANLASSLSTKTGTGNVVFSDNATLTGLTNIASIINTLGASFASNSGNVGIGTVSPMLKLHIFQNATSAIPLARFETLGTNSRPYIDFKGDNTDLGYMGWGGTGSGVLFMMNYLNSDIRLGTNSITRLTITGTGKTGFGTSSPVGAVDIISTTGALIIPRMTNAERTALTGVNGSIVYQTDATSGFYFYENGAWVKK